VEFRVLGPIEVRVDGSSVPLGGPKQRALLALLLLNANQVVSRDRLIDALWGARPPPSAAHSLDAYVSRLRRLVGTDRLLRRAPGYLLRVAEDELDLERFDRLVDEAHASLAAGRAAAAARALREALALWRGEAFADLAYEPFGAVEAERLEGRRLAVLEERIEADLELGADGELIPELQRLVRDHPLRERLVGQLMRALYQAGRQSDALAVLQGARQRLASELGLDPGPELRELERLILQHDPTLAPRRRLRKGQRRALPAVAAACVAAVVVGALVVFGLRASQSVDTASALGAVSRVVAVDLGSGRAHATKAVAEPPSALAMGAGSLWVTYPSANLLARYDPAERVVDRIPVGGEPGTVVFGDGAVWVASTLGGKVTRIDPATDAVTQTVHLEGGNAAALAFGAHRLWVADSTNNTLVELDPANGTVRRTVTLDFSPSAVAATSGFVWAAGYVPGVVAEVDPASGRVVGTIRVGQGPAALAGDGTAVWVANSLDGTISRIESPTGAVTATVPVDSDPVALAVVDGSVWAASADAGTVTRIEPRRGDVIAIRRVGGRPTAVAAGGGTLWVGAGPSGADHRGGMLTIVHASRSPIDPAFNTDTPMAFTRLAYDTLVTFQATTGPSGLRLLPDLALALPTPTDGGTAYTFRLRRGIRYSDGRFVRARDFRRAVERLFLVDSPGASYFAGLVGAEHCTTRGCRLGDGIVTSERTRTVSFRLRVPDPDFLDKLAVISFSAPVPAGTPDREVLSRAIPGTGPYRIARVTKSEVRFARNPFFHEWSHAAQPGGSPAEIVWRHVPSRQAALAAVEHGRADWVVPVIQPTQLRSLRLRYASQLHMNPSFTVEFISLNTRLPPFNDVRVRQALNYAIDRGKVARMYGGRTVATPICQPLAAGMPGYRRYCPYTAHPQRGGTWTRPDMRRARQLVAASGTRGTRVDVWAASDQLGIPHPLPAYVARVLRTLGYRARLRLAPYAAFTPQKRRTLQLTVDGDWTPDYPAPSSYLPQFFGCHGGNNRKRYVCSPRLDRQLRRASTLSARDPAAAAALWTRIDRDLTDRAFWVPTVNMREVDFVSRRLRNYQYQPVWGFLADQAHLR
jgi:peptide/nickel transport system substrate-binding protein